jgi:hypothetical protein
MLSGGVRCVPGNKNNLSRWLALPRGGDRI